MNRTFFRSRRDLAAGAALGLAISLFAVPVVASDDSSTGEEGRQELQFTLITGDVARARVTADGKLGGVRLVSEDGSEIMTSTFQFGDDVYLVPPQAEALIESGRVDRELFNINKLRKAGYDDESTDDLSVLVEYDSGAAPASIPGVTVKAYFDAIDYAAMGVDKNSTAEAWTRLLNDASVESIWLDGVVEAHKAASSGTLTPTIPLTGALGVNAAGLDGSGVKVAVLDTGWDVDHPDLQGQVADMKVFVYGAIDDIAGHGTHVATTVAGTGIESGGLYAGMAPGADLLIGKVLDDRGSGSTYYILKGMQWAVDNGADIINMSLGSTGYSCSGPLVDMIEAYSDQVLFVLSAGNSGYRKSIGVPGCAPSALTVGAIDRDNQTATFSSRGPAPGGKNSKPDIASQGVNVVAAASGGSGDLAYTVKSGTSMAAPHVAGGAALLLQARPELGPRELKAVLTSSVLATDVHVLQQGAGPMDVNRAVTQQVVAPANQSFGWYFYPQKGDSFTAYLPFSNLGDEDVDLKVRMDLIGDDGITQMPATLAELGLKKITVPAGEVVEVPVTVNPGVALRNGAYGVITGRIVATTTGRDDTRVVAPFSFWIQEPMVDLTVEAFDRFGNFASSPSNVTVLNAEDQWYSRSSLYGGPRTITVPEGRYTVVANIMTRDDETNQGLVASAALMADMNVKVDEDTVLEFDAREATRLDFKADRPISPQGFSFGYSYEMNDEGWLRAAGIELAPKYVDELYGWSQGRDDRFHYFATTRAFAPEPVLSTDGGATIGYMPVSRSPMFHGEGSAEVVFVDPPTSSGFAAADLEGKIALVNLTKYQWPSSYSHIKPATAAGAVGILFNYPDTVGRYSRAVDSTIPAVTLAAVEGDKLLAELADGPVVLSWSGTAPERTPYAYSLAHLVDGQVKTGLVRVHDHEMASVETGYHSQGDERTLWTDVYAQLPGVSDFYSTGSSQALVAPVRRTEYFTADPDLGWTNLVMPYYLLASAGGLYDGPFSYAPGQAFASNWLQSPIGASLFSANANISFRVTNRMELNVPWFGDAAGHDGIGGRGARDYAYTRVYIDGKSTYAQSGGYTLPDEDTLVRIEHKYSRSPDASPVYQYVGVAYDTNWEFITSADQQGPQPILVPRIGVPSDLRNTVAAGEPARIRVAGVMDGKGIVELASVKLQYAYGTQSLTYQVSDWTDAVLEKVDGEWFAIVPNGADAGQYVHLRVELADTGSSTVEQAMLRAYLLD